MSITVAILSGSPQEVASALRALAEGLTGTGASVNPPVQKREPEPALDLGSTPDPKLKTKKAKGTGATEGPIPLPAVRKKLSELTQDGKQNAVKKLLAEFGANKLSAIDPADYPALLEKASAL